MRRFAISDIHGCASAFRTMTEAVLCLTAGDTLFLLGDFIDRGEDCKGVIDHVFALQDAGIQVVSLRGNHEQLMLNALYSEDSLAIWLKNGGDATLASFGAASPRDIPDCYLTFFRELGYYAETDGYFLVHAGLNFTQGDPLADREAMLWIRSIRGSSWHHTIDTAWLGNRLIIHGHTPQTREEIETQLAKITHQLPSTPFLCIDAGCVYPQPKGSLCAFDLNKKALHFVAREP